jgi:hypothetical protein
MSNPTVGTTSLRRFGSGASSRLAENLSSSSEAIAAVGLVTALLTIAFLVWFALEQRHQNTVARPMARSSAEMQTALNQSLAALRGWVSYGQDSFRGERREIWLTRLEPELEKLETLAQDSKLAESVGRIVELKSLLRQLKLVEWQIEDVAHTPGNNPALQLYDSRYKPLRNNLLRALGGATDAYRSNSLQPVDPDFLGSLMEFRSSLLLSNWWLQDALVLDDTIYRDNFSGLELGLDSLAARIVDSIDQHTEGDVREALHYAMREYAAAGLLANDILALHESSTSDVAERYFVEQAAPLVDRARDLTGELVDSQVAALEASSLKLTTRSYVIIALAVVMGLLSAGSLSFSWRLKKQVANVLEKARQLGQYELERQIGKGGMGEVYLGHHALLRRPTAVKLISAISAQNLKAQQRFLNEVKLASQLNHPNTIAVYDYGRTPAGIFYFAMEYVEGFCVDTLVRVAGPVHPGRVVAILQQTCGSLQEAHERNFLHRDIKPSNLMLTELGGISDRVKVLDFGLAIDLAEDGKGEEGVIAGTPMYLAPEVILSEEAYSPRSDIYALGAVAYFMLCGETVFASSDTREILACQLQDGIPYPSERLGRSLPQDLEALIMRCLAKDPAERPTTVAELAVELVGCDCPAWTQDDARRWWHSYGETTCHSAGPSVTRVSSAASGVEILVDASRA